MTVSIRLRSDLPADTTAANVLTARTGVDALTTAVGVTTTEFAEHLLS